MRYICAFLLLLAFKGHAQYPFEKFPVRKCDSVKYKLEDINDSSQMATAHYKDYTIKLIEEGDPSEGGKIYLYRKNKLLKKVDGYFCRVVAAQSPLYIEDINNDGIPDLIVQTYSTAGAGLGSSHLYSTCFVSNVKKGFKVLEFESFYDKPQREYEFSHKGNYLIIGQSLVYYKTHNYWLFDLYQYKNGALVNVGRRYNYPIAVPYLDKETFKPTNKISMKELEHLSMRKPGFNSATP